MRKNVMRLTLCAMLFALCFSASAQQPKKVSRIGYLASFDPAFESARAEAIRLAAWAWLHRKDRTSPSSTDTRREITIARS